MPILAGIVGLFLLPLSYGCGAHVRRGGGVVWLELRRGRVCSNGMFLGSERLGGKKERKKEIPYKRACGGHRVHSGYTILCEQGTKGWCSGMCADIIPDRYVCVMAVLSGARVVRVMCVCVAASC